MDGNTLAFIIALVKKQCLKNSEPIGITSIDNVDGNLNFQLSNGKSIKVQLPKNEIHLDNIMKIKDYDKDGNGIIDICDFANNSKESEHSKISDTSINSNESKHSQTSDISNQSKLANDSKKLNGELAENYFNKITNNTDNIIEGSINKFMTKNEKEKLNNLSLNINELLDKKMDIDKYDSNKNGIVDKAETLDGLQVNVNEINKLQGIKENIQKQIDSLSNIGNFTGSANTYKDIQKVNSKPVAKDMIIVIKDENHEDTSTIYMYNGEAWIYSGTFTATVRDFSTKPLDLYKETTGILPQSKVNLQGVAKVIDLNNKLDKVQGSKNNIVVFNEDGIQDSCINISDIQAKEHNHNDLYYTQNQCDNKYTTKDEFKDELQKLPKIDEEVIKSVQQDVAQIKQHIEDIDTEIKNNKLNNKDILDKFSDDGTGLKYNGKEIGSDKEIKLDTNILWSKFEL
ncbi:hypothetical protein G8S21_05185 [Clostridium botulinum C]|uniref:hypothetical protein n=1 Tax=Clostridium botulinum TaxID=1491 RepID=UPI001E2F67E1|nr:hypothetical protein [Clostridium botulinum]MCD3245344.1 hypothetical protein [Clostridium botulinum C]MCD3261723.1 hypothetical protein [Clostridium botulinum C]